MKRLGVRYIGHDEAYDCGLILQLFYDKDEVFVIDGDEKLVDESVSILENSIWQEDDKTICCSKLMSSDGTLLFESNRSFTRRNETDHAYRSKIKRLNKITIYETLETICPSKSKWGTLVGIRPVKIAHEILDKGEGIDEVKGYLKELKVSEEKIDLVCEIALRERPYVELKALDELSLYISIPFCLTRCHYCSFPSNDVKKKGKHVPKYLENILFEVKEIVKFLEGRDEHFDCVYIGGGTPSVLTEEQMDYFLSELHELIDMKLVRELTYEAGRPDTITHKKLEILKGHGVSRICLNPQTFNDRTLVKISREHTVLEFLNAYDMVKEFKFDCVNFDLILGLSDESFEEMKVSIDKAIELGPENITVHTLAVKRASQIKEFNEVHLIGEKTVVEHAIEYMYSAMKEAGYVPYYMYRQKNMVGNLENVGFCKLGKEGLYNMRIMEERHSIIALGAGAVSKISFPEENRFERHSSPKGLEVFIENHHHYLLKHIEALKLKFDE